MNYCPNCWREIHLTTIGFVCSACGYQVTFYDSESTTAGKMRKIKYKEIYEEMKEFPERQHDDIVDAYRLAIYSLKIKQTLWQKIKIWFHKLFKALKHFWHRFLYKDHCRW